jgi:ribose-phosphate pyrophosphokinase
LTLTLLSGTAHPALATLVAGHLGQALAERDIETFPDGELHITVKESLRGHDVYLLQPTGPPVERHVLELLLLADACRRAGAARVTAVIPYFGYARQDRRASGREPVGGRLMADLLAAAGIARVVALDLHAVSLEGFFAMPLEHLTAVPVLVTAVHSERTANGVVVAPDAGATRLAERYARALHLPVAIVQKVRRSGTEVTARGVTGDVKGRAPIIVDDMISTGGTIAAAVAALVAAGCQGDVTVVATHGLFVATALERLAALRLRGLIVTDSLPATAQPSPPVHVVSIAPLLADAVSRLYHDRSLADLLVHE